MPIQGPSRGQRIAAIGLPLAVFGTFIALLPPLNAALALRLNQLDPDSAADNLGLVLGLGALFALVVNPLVGRFSDRTASRWGRRRPWIAAGSVVGFLGLLLVALAPGVPLILMGWILAQTGFNASLAALFAILPDQVPAAWRGRVAAAMGIATNVAVPAGVFFVQLFPATVPQVMVPATIGLVLIAAFVIFLPDPRVPKPSEPFGVVKLFGAFVFNPRRYPDLGWAWLTRALMTCAQMTALSYLTLYLIDEFGMDAGSAATNVFYATLANSVGLLITTSIAGWLSDKADRRKIFVVVAGLIGVVGLVTIALAPSFTWVLIGELIMGAGMGSFYAVDLALVADVLPDDGDNAKDLGVINIAQAAPQSLVPAAAPAVIAATGGYPGLFLTGAAFGILGALAVLPVKKVK
jgi:MFS family permease